jgi:hypothetical protein
MFHYQQSIGIPFEMDYADKMPNVQLNISFPCYFSPTKAMFLLVLVAALQRFGDKNRLAQPLQSIHRKAIIFSLHCPILVTSSPVPLPKESLSLPPDSGAEGYQRVLASGEAY